MRRAFIIQEGMWHTKKSSIVLSFLSSLDGASRHQMISWYSAPLVRDRTTQLPPETSREFLSSDGLISLWTVHTEKWPRKEKGGGPQQFFFIQSPQISLTREVLQCCPRHLSSVWGKDIGPLSSPLFCTVHTRLFSCERSQDLNRCRHLRPWDIGIVALHWSLKGTIRVVFWVVFADCVRKRRLQGSIFCPPKSVMGQEVLDYFMCGRFPF